MDRVVENTGVPAEPCRPAPDAGPPRSCHVPVLLPEAVERLHPQRGGVYVDATFGGGGYTKAILAAGADQVVAIDCDSSAIRRGRETFGAQSEVGVVRFVEGRFCEMERHLPEAAGGVAGIVFDLGASSMQLDNPERGFSFRLDGPLDMRMGPGGPSAADAVNGLDVKRLADILFEYGEEPAARRVARAVARARADGPIRTTGQFAGLVRGAVGGRARRANIDPATRCFQALRIHVNDELGRLARALPAAERLLAPGGVLCVVSFHSLEDRVVKRFLALRGGTGGVNRHLPAKSVRPPSLQLPGKSVTRPGAAETGRNPRARSARLRWAVRTDAAAFPPGVDGNAPWRRGRAG